MLFTLILILHRVEGFLNFTELDVTRVFNVENDSNVGTRVHGTFKQF